MVCTERSGQRRIWDSLQRNLEEYSGGSEEDRTGNVMLCRGDDSSDDTGLSYVTKFVSLHSERSSVCRE